MMSCFCLRSGGLMDKVTDSDSVDAGSIPVRSAKIEIHVIGSLDFEVMAWIFVKWIIF